MIDVCTQESLQFKIVPTGHLYDSGMTHFFLNDSVHPLIRWKRQVTLIPIFLLVCLSRGATNRFYAVHSLHQFLLMRLIRGATWLFHQYVIEISISTHAPLAKRDKDRDKQLSDSTNFYSRASCEARLTNTEGLTVFGNFYSRASCEARQIRPQTQKTTVRFLLTHLSRGATEQRSICSLLAVFLLTRLSRGATFLLQI